MAGNSHGWKEIGIVPLHWYADERVGIVARPEFMEETQRAVIDAAAAAGAEHQFGVGKGFGGFVHQRIKGTNVINPEMGLALRWEPGRTGLGEIAIAVPLRVRNAGCAQNVLDGVPLEF